MKTSRTKMKNCKKKNLGEKSSIENCIDIVFFPLMCVLPVLILQSLWWQVSVDLSPPLSTITTTQDWGGGLCQRGQGAMTTFWKKNHKIWKYLKKKYWHILVKLKSLSVMMDKFKHWFKWHPIARPYDMESLFRNCMVYTKTSIIFFCLFFAKFSTFCAYIYIYIKQKCTIQLQTYKS